MKCVHHWQIETAPRKDHRLHGKCRDCGKAKTFPTSVDGKVIFDAPHARMGAGQPRKKK